MALSTIGTAAIANDAITSAKLDTNIAVDGSITAATSVTAGTELIGNVSGRILLDASASGTDVGDEFLLNATDGSASNDGSKILFEEGTDDVSSMLKSGLPGGITINDSSLPAGAVLQVVSATKIDTQTFSSTSYVDIVGMTVTITPRSATNKILIMFHIGGQGQHENSQMIIKIVRGSTALSVPAASSARSLATIQGFYSHDNNVAEAGAGMFLDSPNTTSATIYKLQGAGTTGNNAYINRPNDLSDSIGRVLGTSSITVMEIAG